MKRIISMINALSIIVSQCHYQIFRKVMVDFYRTFENIIFIQFFDRKFTLNDIKSTIFYLPATMIH